MNMDQGVSGHSRSNLEAEIDKINVAPTEEIDEAEIDEVNVLTEEIMFNKKCRGNTTRSEKIDTTSITGFPP